ncbi:uncharacterized protein LOC122687293 [Cervus elaphus]|uniref:uncharacterized protein LOC122687293 n=1 Tax=Cervus elaphus TaxID=9860 RepID=UPI001CC32BF8|nr:uncharacterized protein LOC122687293 [Cervus elaphus]
MCIHGKILSYSILVSAVPKWADTASSRGGRRQSLPWSCAAASPGLPSPLPRGPSPSSHPVSSPAAASSASSSRKVSSAGSYTSLKAPWPTCPYSGVGKLGAAIFSSSGRRACAKVAHANFLGFNREWISRVVSVLTESQKMVKLKRQPSKDCIPARSINSLFHQPWGVTETQTSSVSKSNRGSFSRSSGRDCGLICFLPVKHQMDSVTGFGRATCMDNTCLQTLKSHAGSCVSGGSSLAAMERFSFRLEPGDRSRRKEGEEKKDAGDPSL